MAITKRPSTQRDVPSSETERAQAVFIEGGADGRRKGAMRGRRVQISHTIPPMLLATVDEQADKKGLTRAGLINLAISEFLEKSAL